MPYAESWGPHPWQDSSRISSFRLHTYITFTHTSTWVSFLNTFNCFPFLFPVFIPTYNLPSRKGKNRQHLNCIWYYLSPKKPSMKGKFYRVRAGMVELQDWIRKGVQKLLKKMASHRDSAGERGKQTQNGKVRNQAGALLFDTVLTSLHCLEASLKPMSGLSAPLEPKINLSYSICPLYLPIPWFFPLLDSKVSG